MNSSSTLNGLILNGGSSSRMGTPKGELAFHHIPQYQHLFNLLTPFCSQVFLSVKSVSQSINIPQITDLLTIDTPLNGIFSAFSYSSSTAWLIVANDMPFLDQETLTDLVKHRDPDKVATCFYDSSGNRPEPLISIWEAGAFPILKTYIESGGVSPRLFLESNSIKLVSVKNPDILLNVNSPEELALFQKKHQKS